MDSSTTSTAVPPDDAGAPVQVAARTEVSSLRELTPAQWKSGIAAWLGWLFDGLDMHLYGLIAGPFVASLMLISDSNDPQVKEKMGWIQAAFLVGWALGGGFFGRIGDLIGRSRALCLTILAYACFTGFSFFAASWQQLLVFRFIAALGIGGEWAVGSSLLSETWPRKWAPWIAAVLQTGVNIGVLLACGASDLLHNYPPKYVFLVGLVPALLVLWIRRAVPEPEEWHVAKRASVGNAPRVRELFRGGVRRTTLLTIVVCACSLTPWWAFMFWNNQNMRSLAEQAGWTSDVVKSAVPRQFFLVIFASCIGNFFAGWLAKQFGFRRAIALMCLGFLAAMTATFYAERDFVSMLWYIPWVGFFSGVFGLFTMYLPPLFPVLLRTTGAGFSYNIGRLVAAAGTIFSAQLSIWLDFRHTLLYVGFLFIPAMIVAWFLPDLRADGHAKTSAD